MITKPTSRTINSSDNAYPLNAISEINTPRSRTNPLVTEDKNKAPGLMHEPYKSPARINSKAQEKKDKKPIEIEPGTIPELEVATKCQPACCSIM